MTHKTRGGTRAAKTIRELLALILPAMFASPVALASDSEQSVPSLFTRGSWVGTATVGRFDPLDQDRDIGIYDGRLGVGYYFRDALAIVGELHAGAFDGSRRLEETGELRQVSSAGLGGALLIRWHFLQRERWSSFFDLGWGLLLTDDEFPPGGTELNGTRQYGLGLTYQTGDRFHLVFGARQLHISNGRGFVEDNPSYDGVGAYFGGAFRLGRGAAVEQDRTPAPIVDRRPMEHRFGYRVEGQVGDADDEDFFGGLIDLDFRLQDRWWAQLEISGADVAGETFTDLGLSVYRRGERGLMAVAVSRQELDVFSTHQVTLQAERFLNDLATAVGVAGWEERKRDADRWLGAPAAAAAPDPQLARRAGHCAGRRALLRLRSRRCRADAQPRIPASGPAQAGRFVLPAGPRRPVPGRGANRRGQSTDPAPALPRGWALQSPLLKRSCDQVRMTASGDLELRGYVGVRLIGRTSH